MVMRVSCVTDIPQVPALASRDKLGGEAETIFPKGKKQLLAQTWNLLCFPRYFWEFLTQTYIFSSLTFSILNQIVSDCTPAKTSCKTSSESFYVLWKFSRKWNEQVKLWKQRLRYSIVRNEKIFSNHWVRKAFIRRLGKFFLSDKKKLFAVENI